MGNITMLNRTLDEVKRELTRLDNITVQPEEYVEKQARLLTTLAQGMEEFDGEVAQLRAENKELQKELAKTKQTSEKYRQMLFGASSEQTKAILGNEVSDATGTKESAEGEEPTIEDATASPEQPKGKKNSPKVKGMREATLHNLKEMEPPVLHELLESEQKCEECGGALGELGEETVRWELVYARAKVFKRRHIRKSYICPKCKKEGEREVIKHARVTPALQHGSLQTPSINAHVFNAKFVNAMPIDRIAKDFERDGVYLKTDTLVRRINHAAHEWLKPIYNILRAEMCKEPISHVDATSLQVNNEPGRAAQTPSCIWQAQTGKYALHQIVLFYYFLTENVADLMSVLKGFKGYLQCDGKNSYHKFPADVVIVGCWQHMRDYVIIVLKAIDKKVDRGKTPGAIGLKLINEMFSLERTFSELKFTVEQRYQARLTQIKPLIDKFYEWIDEIASQPRLIALNPAYGDLITYARNQRQYLENVLLDGRLELSNNRAARMFVRFAIGRNNWMFCITPSGAEALVINYTIALTALANGVHPELYYEYLLEHIPNAPSDIDYNDYLPWSDKLPERLKLPPTYKELLKAQKHAQAE